MIGFSLKDNKFNPLSHCKVWNSCGLECKVTQEFPLTPAVLVRANELFQGFVLSLAPCGTEVQTGEFPPQGALSSLTLAQAPSVITFHLGQSQGKLQIEPFSFLILAFPLVLLYHMILQCHESLHNFGDRICQL